MFDGKAAQLEAANQRIALLDKQLAATQAQLKQLEDRNIKQELKRKQQEQAPEPVPAHSPARGPERGLVAPLAVLPGTAGGGCRTETRTNEEVRRGALGAPHAARRLDKLDKEAILNRIFSEEEEGEPSGQGVAALAGRAGADGSANALLQVGTCLSFLLFSSYFFLSSSH